MNPQALFGNPLDDDPLLSQAQSHFDKVAHGLSPEPMQDLAHGLSKLAFALNSLQVRVRNIEKKTSLDPLA